MKYYRKIAYFVGYVFMAFIVVPVIFILGIPEIFREWKNLNAERKRKYGDRIKPKRFLGWLFGLFVGTQKDIWRSFWKKGDRE